MSTPSALPCDELTGLPLRKAFHEMIDAALERVKGSDTPVSVAFVDIDNFLSVNTDFGRAAGDEVLKTVAGLIRTHYGENAIPVRYGGDEFAIIFPETEREQAFLLLEALRRAVESTEFKAPKSGASFGPLTISAGLACHPVDGRLKSELLRKADQALYRAKVVGRNTVRLAYDEKMVPKTSHYTQTQLERLTKLAAERQAGEAELLREALDDLLAKYGVTQIERWT